MGFQLNIVMSSTDDPDARRSVLAAAIQQWPFIRLLRTTDRHEDGILFAPPGLTSNLFEDNESYESAVEMCGEFKDDLTQCSNSSQR